MTQRIHLDQLPRTVELLHGSDGGSELRYIDQRKLPGELVFERTGDWRQVVDAIETLAVRGAPALGVAGAAALALWACNEGATQASLCGCSEASGRFREALSSVAHAVSIARPTAVNLAWGVAQLVSQADDALRSGLQPWEVADGLFDRVKELEAADEAANRAIGACGAALLPNNARVLTHCNAGSLATVFYGTALGVVYAAAEKGGIARVYADETRPVGQGARLTVWELSRAGIPVTLICDNMAASLMSRGEVDAVVVGADRIAANGDAANKIGTLGVAILAQHYGIPFYVAAPSSTVDLSLETGAYIPIEERSATEVLPCSIAGVEVWNPAFDVTPAKLISHIVTERGAFRPSELRAGIS